MCSTNFYFFPILQPSLGDSCRLLWAKHESVNRFFLNPIVSEKINFAKKRKGLAKHVAAAIVNG